MRDGAAAILLLLIALPLAGSTPEAELPRDSETATFLPDSVRITIIPDSLVDSLGAFTRGPAPEPAASRLNPRDMRDRVDALRRRVHFDRDDVAACVELAELLAPSRDIELRREAAEALRQALRIAEKDPDLWVQFARLQERRGFHSEAHDAYRNALRISPDRADIWQSVAQHEFIRFQRQLLWKHLADARRANDRVLRERPEDVASIRRGVRIAMLDGDQAAVDSLVQKWEEALPPDPWARLVRGMLFADDGAWERAEEAFSRGLALLPERERRAFQRLDTLTPQDEEMRMESLDRLRFVRDFWKWRDPTPADALNPRLLEHYRRMVQAELLFALESYHLHGWNHAPGEMLVRYGLPKNWTFRDGFGQLGEYRVTYNALVASRSVEIPYGPEGMPILFVDYNQNGRFFYPIEGWPTDEELHLSEYPTAYDSPVVESREQEVEVWRFQNAAGEGRLEVAVALSRREWKEVLDRPYRLSTKLTVYDKDWEEGDARIGSWAPFTVDALGRLVARFEASGDADSLILGLETSSRDQSYRAAGYATVPPRSTLHGLELSDLAFVSRVSFERPGGAYGWNYGSAIPNPGHRYRAGDPIGIAFEGYGLRTDPGGDLRARIRVSVARQTRTGWLRVLLGKGKSGEAELVFDATEPGSTLHQLLAFELPPLNSGTYQLRLHVEDKISGENAEITDVFQILERGWRP